MTALLARFRKDEDGAISVMGIFMAVLLVGFLYFMWGIGDTVVYREHMQDAVDATGWGAAVVHARGMNILVLINMIMAAIAAVLIALKIILFILMILYVIFTVLCAIPYTAAFGCSAQSATDSAKEAVQEVHDAVEDFANEAWPILHDAADAIKWAIPPIAFAKSVDIAMNVYDMEFGGFYSSTLTGGLPVEDDECRVLEQQGSRYAGNLVTFGSMGDDPDKQRVLTKVMTGVYDTAAALYGKICEDSGGGGEPSFDFTELIEDEVGASGDCSGDDPPDDCDDIDTSAAEDISAGVESNDTTSDSDKSPKRVKEDCYLGDDCFQIRAGVIGNPPIDETRKGVTIAMWGASDSSSESMFRQLTRFNLSQSEFYFDMPNAHEYRDFWMWQMNWRARMRRFRFGSGSSAMDIFSGSSDSSLGGFGDTIQNVMVH